MLFAMAFDRAGLPVSQRQSRRNFPQPQLYSLSRCGPSGEEMRIFTVPEITALQAVTGIRLGEQRGSPL